LLVVEKVQKLREQLDILNILLELPFLKTWFLNTWFLVPNKNKMLRESINKQININKTFIFKG
jgi:hypothetical protein